MSCSSHFVFCSGISHSYSTQRDKILPKLTKLAINNRRFDGRTLESPASIANNVIYIFSLKNHLIAIILASSFINVSLVVSYFVEHGKVLVESIERNVERYICSEYWPETSKKDVY